MLLAENMINRAGGPEVGDWSPSISTAIEQAMQFVRRRKYILGAGPAVGILLALAYLLVTPSQYTATATVLIDSNTLRVLQSQSQQLADNPLDTIQVGSQLDILESDNLALAVIRKLKLTEDPEFVKTGAEPISSANAKTALEEKGVAEEKEQEALDAFARRRNVTRLERSYGLDISFTSKSPVKAAKIANAIANAYIADQLEVSDQTRRRAGAWLEERIETLKAQVTAADRAVLEFKEKNKIVDLGGQGAAQGTPGRLIEEQQLADLNTQLATARGATSEARARLDRIEEIRKQDVSQAEVPDTLRNDVITRLRNKYLDLSAREVNISEHYGSDHEAAMNLRSQMEEVSRNISAELGRIAASYQSDYEIAKARQENLEHDLASLVKEGRVTNRDKIGLAELQSSATVYHSIYDSFLQRYMDAIQQETFPIAEARIISLAAPPSQKSKPHGMLVIAIATTMGLIVSFGGAALREVTDSVFRTSRQVEQYLQVVCLSVIPLLSAKDLNGPAINRSIVWRRPHDGDQLPSPDDKSKGGLDPTASVAFSDPNLRHAVDYPLSVFAEAVRAIKVSVQRETAIRPNVKVIGVTSTFPNEGKSTISCNLAMLMADAGKRVILLDADLRNPNLARSLHTRPAVGLIELLSGKITLEQAISSEPNTHLTLLPVVLEEPLAHVDEILSSQIFENLINQLRQLYDYVIVDLPPVAPVVDVRAVLPVIDSLVFIMEWGSARIGAAQNYLAAPEIRERLLGVALNKANLKELQRFEIPGLRHEGYYGNLGYDHATRTDRT
jgi:polysaccharide biosynthesis transport protein